MKHLKTICALGGCRLGYDEKGAREAAEALVRDDLTLIERALTIGMLNECAGGVEKFKDADWFRRQRDDHSDWLFAQFSSTGNAEEWFTLLAYALLAFPIAEPALRALRDQISDRKLRYGKAVIDETLAIAVAKKAKRTQPAAAHH